MQKISYDFLEYRKGKEKPGDRVSIPVSDIVYRLGDSFSDILYIPGSLYFVESVLIDWFARDKVHEKYDPVSAVEYVLSIKDEKTFLQFLIHTVEYELKRRRGDDTELKFWTGTESNGFTAFFRRLFGIKSSSADFDDQLKKLFTQDCFGKLGCRKSMMVLVCMMPLINDFVLEEFLHRFYNCFVNYDLRDEKGNKIEKTLISDIKRELVGENSKGKLYWKNGLCSLKRKDIWAAVLNNLGIEAASFRKNYNISWLTVREIGRRRRNSAPVFDLPPIVENEQRAAEAEDVKPKLTFEFMASLASTQSR